MIKTIKAFCDQNKFIRDRLLPFSGPVLILLSPLIYEDGLDDKNKFISFIFLILIAGIFSQLNKVIKDDRIKKAEATIKGDANIISNLKSRKEKLELALKEQARIASYMRHIVQEKSNRFAKMYRTLKAKRSSDGELNDANEIFSELAKPDDQIELILERLSMFFQHENETSRRTEVYLFIPDQDLNHFKYYKSYPKDNKPALDEEKFYLNTGVCGRAFTTNGMAIVEDIEVDLKSKNPMYFVSDVSTPKKGSIVCLPIYDGINSMISFILCIYVNEPNVFLEKNTEHIKVLLDEFIHRILLESRLKLIKTTCNV